MKAKKIAIILFSVLMSLNIIGCDDKNDTSESIITTTQAVQTTTEAKPSLTAEEAKKRATDAIQDEIDDINPYSLDLGMVYEFAGFRTASCYFDTQYDKNSDSYVFSTTEGHCSIKTTFEGTEIFSPCCIEFEAEVTVYSNGDTHVNKFDYTVNTEW